MRPAVRIVFAPLLRRNKTERDKGLHTHGEARARTIKIDPRSSMLLDTLVHELTHVRHPDWSEVMVREYVKTWMKKSSWKRKARFLCLLGAATLEGEPSGTSGRTITRPRTQSKR
jgi:hypothetical protein